MGTTKTGRLLNTYGSARLASEYSVVHSNEGDFTKSTKKNRIRLKAGGHGQDGMDLLDKYGIKYNIVYTYANGVRIGNVPKHKNKRKQTGTNQSWFPKSWTSKDIKRAGEHVANLKKNRHSKDGVAVFGMWKGVKVGVIRTNGKIATIFPDTNQPYTKKRKKRRIK